MIRLSWELAATKMPSDWLAVVRLRSMMLSKAGHTIVAGPCCRKLMPEAMFPVLPGSGGNGAPGGGLHTWPWSPTPESKLPLTWLDSIRLPLAPGPSMRMPSFWAVLPQPPPVPPTLLFCTWLSLTTLSSELPMRVIPP
jgi:hypothetical protein